MAKKKAFNSPHSKMVKKKTYQGNNNANNAPKDDASTSSAGQKRKFNDKNIKKKTYLGRCRKLLSNMMELDDSKPFRTAVDKLKYPDYHAEVRYDIDLTRIATKLSMGQYGDPVDFGEDVRLMVNNWKVYIKDHSLPIYSQISRLGWWFESEFSKIKNAFEDHKNKRRRLEEAAARPTEPPSTIKNLVIPTPPHLMSTVAENGILRIRRAPGAATSQPQGRSTSQANANMGDLRNQIRNNQRNPRPSTLTQGNDRSIPTGAPLGGADRTDRQRIAAVINATRVAVSSQARPTNNVSDNSNQGRGSGQHHSNAITTASPSVPSRIPPPSLASRLGPAPVTSRSPSIASRLGPAPSSGRLAATPLSGRLGVSIPPRLPPASTYHPTPSPASQSSPRTNTPVSGNNTTGNSVTRPPRTTTASPRVSPSPAQSSATSTPSSGAVVPTPAAAQVPQEPELELLVGASHVWFGECKSKPPREIRITDQGIEFPIKSMNYEAVINVNANDIVRCCGHFGNLGKLQNTLFLFLTPSATKHVRTCLTDNGMSGDVVSLIVIFSQNMTTEKISRLIHIFWRIGRQSIFGPLFSEVDKKGALNIIANIKPQILQRLSQNMSSASTASGDGSSPAVQSPSVPQTPKSAVPNLTAAQTRRNSASESVNPSSTTSDRRSDQDVEAGIQNTNGAATAAGVEPQAKNSNNSTASHGYTFKRSRLPLIDSSSREPRNWPHRGNSSPFPNLGPRFPPRNPNFGEPHQENHINEGRTNNYPGCNNNAFQDSNHSFDMQHSHQNSSRRYPDWAGGNQSRDRYPPRLMDQMPHLTNWAQDDCFSQNHELIPQLATGYQPTLNTPRREQIVEVDVYVHNSDMNPHQPAGYPASHNASRREHIHTEPNDQNQGTRTQNQPGVYQSTQDQPAGLSPTENQVTHNGGHDSNNMELDDSLIRSVQLLEETESDERRIRIRISHQHPDDDQNQESNDIEMAPADATPPGGDDGTHIEENYNNAVLDSNVSSTVQTCNTDTEIETSDIPPLEASADFDTELVTSSEPNPATDVDTAVPSDSDAQTADEQQDPPLDLRPESEQVDEAHEISDDDDDDLEIIIPSDIDDDMAFVPASIRQTKDEDGDDLVMMASRISTKCPVTQQVMKRPFKNRHCGHCYDRDGIQQLIINRTTKARCPVPGCTNPNVLKMSDMDFDYKLFEYIHTHNADPDLQRDLDNIAEELAKRSGWTPNH